MAAHSTQIAGNICVLFTANDAYLRDFRIFAPSDCSASNTAEENDLARRRPVGVGMPPFKEGR